MRSRRFEIFAVVAATLALASCGPKSVARAADSPAGEVFLKKNATAEGVKTLPSGLQYKVVESGPANGVSPKIGDDVKVNYEGTLIDGTVFDSSYQGGEPIVFTLGQVIPAWNEALQLMKPGDVWYLYVPSKLGYGDAGKGPIAPGAVMVFKVELMGVLPARGHGGTANG
jgi:FKBP-type peptidyl-prolyl cis-trans isomerase FklB